MIQHFDLNFEIILVTAFGMISAFIIWIFRLVWATAKENRRLIDITHDKINELEVLVAGKYIVRNEFNIFCGVVLSKLDNIADKLENKVDKLN